jgi:uncharacterized integral membrane protein
MIQESISEKIYSGQFGSFTITEDDRQGVITYRSSLLVAAICFCLGAVMAVLPDQNPLLINLLTWLYLGFAIALGIALGKIHIYLKILHRTLQVFWLIGCGSALIFAAIAAQNHLPFALYIYQNPLTILGIGFTFAALTGIFFKEAFCFDRLETKLLVAIVPIFLLGHLFGILAITLEKSLLVAWAVLFMIFAGRKFLQDIPSDIGDKSVFEHLEKPSQL